LLQTEPDTIELPYHTLPYQEATYWFIQDEEWDDEFPEIKEVNTTEEETKGYISEQA